MDPRKLFADARLTGRCVYCGGEPSTRDHVPSRVLLDEPFPPDLPIVQACEACNNGFSTNEQYLACLLECVLCGTVDPALVCRDKIKRVLSENAPLALRIAASCRADEASNLLWEAEVDRVRNVILKLARGHEHTNIANPSWGSPRMSRFFQSP